MIAAIVSIVTSIIPGKAIALALGAAGLFAGLFIRGKVAQIEEKREENHLAEKINENHAVEVKESTATSDEEADAALDAAAKSDR